ncbi:hypothetical protein PVAP13_2KG203336 [Panicum virgatum]|uniref:Uncharacterized protein n=1 Tax=Panicum virgatum TaxID=38727 RepID=A0A8T0W5D4_PANVG|nr:hypothetical protein PVAP13_2KG203336 [Panicum virgatum]
MTCLCWPPAAGGERALLPSGVSQAVSLASLSGSRPSCQAHLLFSSSANLPSYQELALFVHRRESMDAWTCREMLCNRLFFIARRQGHWSRGSC